jgi:hypothetical protein
MRKIALVFVLLAVTLCLLASGTERETVKVYFTAGEYHYPGSQLWRCNLDGSEPELLTTMPGLGDVAVDSATQKLFLVGWDPTDNQLYVADLDGSNIAYFAYLTGEDPPRHTVDANGGYVCYAESEASHIWTARIDGSDQQWFYLSDIPGMVTNGRVKGVALHVESGSPVQSTTWGTIKSRFR